VPPINEMAKLSGGGVLQPKPVVGQIGQSHNNQSHVQQYQRQSSSTSGQATASTASVNKHGHSHYQIGQTLSHRNHSLPFSSQSQASILISKLPLNSPLFVKRTNREWTYAVLVGRMKDSDDENDCDKMSVIVALDDKRKVKKVLERCKWRLCLKLVNEKAIGSSIAPTAAAADTTAIDSSPSCCSASIASTINDGRCSTLNHSTASSSYQRKNSAPEPRRKNSVQEACRRRTHSNSDRPVVDNFHRVDCSSSAPTTARAATASMATRRSTSAAAAAAKATVASTASEDATSSPALLAVQRAHNRSLNRRNSAPEDLAKSARLHSGTTTNGSSSKPSPSHRGAAIAVANDALRQSATCSTASLTTSLSNTSSSSSTSLALKKLFPNRFTTPSKLAPTTFTQPESPTTVMVNLNAKTFSGSRRDRMRPRANMQRRISAPSLLQLGSLGGTSPQAAAGETDTSSDATCAPNNNGGSSSNNAGSLWNSLSSFHSSCDSLEHMDTMPPHATATTTTYTSGTGGLPSNATLGGGMTMRLRGVDP